MSNPNTFLPSSSSSSTSRRRHFLSSSSPPPPSPYSSSSSLLPPRLPTEQAVAKTTLSSIFTRKILWTFFYSIIITILALILLLCNRFGFFGNDSGRKLIPFFEPLLLSSPLIFKEATVHYNGLRQVSADEGSLLFVGSPPVADVEKEFNWTIYLDNSTMDLNRVAFDRITQGNMKMTFNMPRVRGFSLFVSSASTKSGNWGTSYNMTEYLDYIDKNEYLFTIPRDDGRQLWEGARFEFVIQKAQDVEHQVLNWTITFTGFQKTYNTSHAISTCASPLTTCIHRLPLFTRSYLIIPSAFDGYDLFTLFYTPRWAYVGPSLMALMGGAGLSLFGIYWIWVHNVSLADRIGVELGSVGAGSNAEERQPFFVDYDDVDGEVEDGMGEDDL
ncbi:hypothetical protein BC829DRAFT_389872 [Chytridium lagenaria]|nr:hypothetical protein BC829DRAFT_389872 [Chytridium lagenaria]